MVPYDAGPEDNSSGAHYLHLKKLIRDDIIWVDNIDGLLTATIYIEGCEIIGIDCEWKPNYERGSRPNKVTSRLIGTSALQFQLFLEQYHYLSILCACLGVVCLKVIVHDEMLC